MHLTSSTHVVYKIMQNVTIQVHVLCSTCGSSDGRSRQLSDPVSGRPSAHLSYRIPVHMFDPLRTHASVIQTSDHADNLVFMQMQVRHCSGQHSRVLPQLPNYPTIINRAADVPLFLLFLVHLFATKNDRDRANLCNAGPAPVPSWTVWKARSCAGRGRATFGDADAEARASSARRQKLVCCVAPLCLSLVSLSLVSCQVQHVHSWPRSGDHAGTPLAFADFMPQERCCASSDSNFFMKPSCPLSLAKALYQRVRMALTLRGVAVEVRNPQLSLFQAWTCQDAVTCALRSLLGFMQTFESSAC